MRSANPAIRILSQLQLAETHTQGVYKKQPPDQGLAFSDNQLDGLGRLDQAHQSGQDAEHSAFGTRGNQSGRGWLRIEAAITWAILGGKDAGLPFKAKDRSVDIGLAGKYAGVVDQKACRKVIGAVHDDGEALEN